VLQPGESRGTVRRSERSNTAPTRSSRTKRDESWRTRLPSRGVSSPNATSRHPSSSSASSAHATTPSVRERRRADRHPLPRPVHDDGRSLRRPGRLRWCARSSSRNWVQPRRRTTSPPPSAHRSTSCVRSHEPRRRSARCRSTAHRWTTTARVSPPFSRARTVSSSGPRTEDRGPRTEDRACLAGVLTELDDDKRELLLMRYVDGLTQREIGELRGVSQRHVSRCLRRVVAPARASRR